MSWFNETLGDIWENHLPVFLTQLPTSLLDHWFTSLLVYMFCIYILLLCAVQIFRLLNNLYVCDDMGKAFACQRMMLDELCMMIFDLLFRPIYCAVYYIIVHIIGLIIKDSVSLFRYISTIISTTFNRRDRKISPAEPDQHTDLNVHKVSLDTNVTE